MTIEEILMSDEFIDKLATKLLEKMYPADIIAVNPIEYTCATFDIATFVAQAKDKS